MSRRRVWGVALMIAVTALVAVWYWTHLESSKSAHHAGQQATSTARKSAGALGQEPAAVAGTVFLDQAPAPNATVRLIADRGGSTLEAQTDTSGHFDLGAVAVGRYYVVAEVSHAVGAT